MAPVRTPGGKAAYATTPDPEPHPKSPLSADLSPLEINLALPSGSSYTQFLLKSPASFPQLRLLKLLEICKNPVLYIFYLVSTW